MQGSILGNIRNAFLWDNIGIFLKILELENSASANIRKYMNFSNIRIRKFRFRNSVKLFQARNCKNIKNSEYNENFA